MRHLSQKQDCKKCYSESELKAHRQIRKRKNSKKYDKAKKQEISAKKKRVLQGQQGWNW